MFCQRCGAQLPENTSKCPHCGAEYKVENTSAPIADNKKSPKKSFFTKKKIIITVIIAVILIAGGIVAAITLVNGSSISISTTDMLQLADRYLKEMNYEQAIVEFQKILEIEPKNVEAYIGLAEAYVGLGETDKAIEALRQGQENTGSKKVGDRLREIQAAAETTTEATIGTTEASLTTTEITTVETTTAVTTTTTETIVTSTTPNVVTTAETTTTTAPEKVTTTTPVATTTAATVTAATSAVTTTTAAPVTQTTTATSSAATQTTTVAPDAQVIVPSSSSTSFDVPSITQNALAIDPITQVTAIAENANILSYKGHITEKNQEDNYTFTAPRDGCYRFEFSGIMSGNSMNLYIRNNLGEIIKSNTSCGNGNGVAVYDMKAEETYTIEVDYNSGYSSYTLLIGQQKPTVNISNLTSLRDSIEFAFQENIYLFTAPRDGRYRFEFSEIMSGSSMNLYIRNDLGEIIKSNTSCSNGNGVAVYDMKAGETYTVEVDYNSGYSSYTLLIGQQKPTVNISNLTSLRDSIEFAFQENIYLFTAPRDGRYRFEFSEIMSGSSMNLYIRNNLGEIITSNTSCSNGNGVAVYDMKAGEAYTIEVDYNSGYSSYTLLIGQQKPTVNISNLTSLRDSIEFAFQENIYLFTVPRDGRYRFEFSEIMSGSSMNLYIRNNLGEIITSNTSCSNGNGVAVYDMKVGEIYTIEIDYNSGYSSYIFSIELQS